MQRADRFKAFCYYYLTHHLECDFSDMHNEWFDILQLNKAAIAAPRFFGKSRIFTVFYPLFCILEEGPTKLLIISSTSSQAEDSLSMIKRELETNPLIIEDFGLQKGTTWRNDLISLANGSQIEAKGAEAKVRGKHPDRVLVDDIEDDESVATKEQRDKRMDWFLKALLPVGGPKTQFLVSGTILNEDSLLNNLITKENFKKAKWHQKLYQALDSEDKSVWESRYPTDWLHAVREERGIAAFQQEYMNVPIPAEWKPFKPEILNFYTNDVSTGLSYTITCDLAATTNERSDYTAIVVVGTDEQGTMYVVDYIKKKLLPGEIIDMLFNLYTIYKPHTIGIEDLGFQAWLKNDFEKECAKRHIYPYILGLKPDAANGRRKRFRIESLEPHFRRKRLWIKSSHTELIAELLAFPAAVHDDLMDALAYQLDICYPAKGKPKEDPNPNTFIGHLMRKKKASKRIKKLTPWSNRHSGW